MRGRVLFAGLLLAMLTTTPVRAEETLTAQAAARAFDEICVRQAPGFLRVRAMMARHGLTRRPGHTAYRHASGRMWARLDRRGAGRAQCRVTYQVPDAADVAAAIEAIARRLFEDAWGRRETSTWTGRFGTAWSVSIHGVLGEMVHVPYSGAGAAGIMILRF